MTQATRTFPAFVERDSEGFICGMYEAGAADRLNFKVVYGIARANARTHGGTVECVRSESYPVNPDGSIQRGKLRWVN